MTATNPQHELVRLITEAITPICVNGVLPTNSVLLVLDPVTRSWDHYAVGGSATWFEDVIEEDSITEVYRAARLETSLGQIVVDYHW